MTSEHVNPSGVSSLSGDSDPAIKEPATVIHEKPEIASKTGENESPIERVNEVIAEAKHQDSAPDAPQDEEEDESKYPTAWKLSVVVLALCLAVFCVALDNTIIATAIPRITDQFHALDDVAWYGSAYLLFTCAFQLFFGRLYTFFNIKLVYLIAIGIFELGSLVCATAPTSNALIVGRCLAGLGAAGLFSGSILIVAHTVPLRKRPIYTGFIGGMYGIASVAGPLMGGAFTDNPHLTWRWCFYINLPLGAVTIFFITFFLQMPKVEQDLKLTWREKLERLDFIGTFVLIPCVVCVLLALQWGGSTYPWSDGRIIALFVVFGVLAIAFGLIQMWRKEYATVPPRIFVNRTVWSAAWFAAAMGGSFFILIYYMPIWFQAIKGNSAVESGIHTLPLVLGVTVFSIVSGVGVTIMGYYKPWFFISVIFVSVGCGLLSTFKVNTGIGRWVGFQIIAGAGFGMGIQNPMIAVQAALPLKDVPVGTAMIMFSQTLGGAIFIAIGQNVFLNQLQSNAQALVPQFPVEIILRTGATTLAQAVPKALLPKILTAYNESLIQTWYVSVAGGAIAIIGAIFLENKSVKGKKLGPGAA